MIKRIKQGKPFISEFMNLKELRKIKNDSIILPRTTNYQFDNLDIPKFSINFQRNYQNFKKNIKKLKEKSGKNIIYDTLEGDLNEKMNDIL